MPAGMPSTREITSVVISGAGYYRHTDDNFYRGELQMGRDVVQKVVRYLEVLFREASVFYGDDGGRPVNYEDIAYLSIQIRDNRTESENPAVQAFIEKILPEVAPYFLSETMDPLDEAKPGGLFWEAANYIKCVVWNELSRFAKSRAHLNCLVDACRSSEVSSVDIFSLNHDMLIERALEYSGIKYVDGFRLPVNGVRYWRPQLYEQPDSPPRLFKLHGSVNWFRFRDNEKTGRNPYGIPIGQDHFHTRAPNGEMQWPMDSCPELLVGTFNKTVAYNSGIFAEVHNLFFRSLPGVDLLIVAGYGFGDKGINSRVVDFMADRPSKKMFVIDPDLNGLKTRARGAIGNRWDQWVSGGRLKGFPKGIEALTWHELPIDDVLPEVVHAL